MTRAEEIFKATAERMAPGEWKKWITVEEAARLERERWIESSPFSWSKQNGRLVALTEGRPSRKCPGCMMEIYYGVLASGKRVLVTKQGLWHEHKQRG